MKRTLLNFLLCAALSGGLFTVSTPVSAQHRGSSTSQNTRTGGSSSHARSSNSSVSSRPSSTNNGSVNRSSSASHGNNKPATVGGSHNDNRKPSTGGTVNHGNSSSNRPSGSTGSVNNSGRRPQNGGTRPGGNNGGTGSVTRPSTGGNGNHGGTRPGGNNGGGSSFGNNHGGNNGNHNGNHGNVGGSHNRNHGNNGRTGGFSNRPTNNHHPGIGDKPKSGHNYNHYGYGHHSDVRPRGHNDRFYSHYTRNDWSWHHPVRPPARAYRPGIWYYRPVRPANWHVYYGRPSIGSILGLAFGTMFDASLNYLYYSGYNIDGYYDNVVYLRDVPFLSYNWPDVMLQYDANGLVYAQFALSSGYYNRTYYNRIYHELSATYGRPVITTGMQVTWFGGDGRGFVTLNLASEGRRYYTTVSVGY